MFCQLFSKGRTGTSRAVIVYVKTARRSGMLVVWFVFLAAGSSSGNGQASVRAGDLLLPEGTAVKLKLLHSLRSKTVVVDDPLNFSLAEDILVDGNTVVKAGAVAIGRVRKAQAARTFGRGAELALDMQYLKAGQIRVPLRGSPVRAGQGKEGEMVALTIAFGVSGLFKHGSEIEVKEGSIFVAYVSQDTNVPLAAGPLQQGQSPKSEGGPYENQDGRAAPGGSVF